MDPVSVVLCITTFGYNKSEVVAPNPPSPPGYIALYMRLKDKILSIGAKTGIIVTAQPPKTTAGAVTDAERDACTPVTGCDHLGNGKAAPPQRHRLMPCRSIILPFIAASGRPGEGDGGMR